MAVERSAGAVVFYWGAKGVEYLLLRHTGGSSGVGKKEYWSFPKGHIEKGENSTDAALREISEETGLATVKIIDGFKETDRYVYVLEGEKILKFVVWFLAQAKTKKVTLSFEHSDFQWLPYREAHKEIVYRGTTRILEHAHQFLSRKV